jgi:uncharacterized protein YraI
MKRLTIVTTIVILMLTALLPQTASAGMEGTGWYGEFYSNMNLEGSPVFKITHSEINFDWGNNGPTPTFKADEWSARWNSYIYLGGGTYRFTAKADDGIRIWVDNSLVINEWHTAFDTTYTGEVYVPAGFHRIRVEYFDQIGAAKIEVKFGFVGSGGTLLDPITNIWTAKYYNNTTLAGSAAATHKQANILYDWGAGSPDPAVNADNFSAKWKSQNIRVDPGTYRFTIVADGGVRFIIGGTVMLDTRSDPKPGKALISDVTFSADYGHTLILEYYHTTGNAYIRMITEPLLPPINPSSNIPIELVSGAAGGTGGPVTQQPVEQIPPASGISGQITAGALNVRDMPGTYGNILGQLTRGETVPLIGRNQAGTWLQASTQHGVGWISKYYVQVLGDFNMIPIVGMATDTSGDPVGRVWSTALNVRPAPNSNNTPIDAVVQGTLLPIIGRSSNGYWLKVDSPFGVGWVSARYVEITGDITKAPVTNQ